MRLDKKNLFRGKICIHLFQSFLVKFNEIAIEKLGLIILI